MNLKAILKNGFTKRNNLVMGFFFFESAAIFSFPYQIYSSVQVFAIPAWI